ARPVRVSSLGRLSPAPVGAQHVPEGTAPRLRRGRASRRSCTAPGRRTDDPPGHRGRLKAANPVFDPRAAPGSGDHPRAADRGRSAARVAEELVNPPATWANTGSVSAEPGLRSRANLPNGEHGTKHPTPLGPAPALAALTTEAGRGTTGCSKKREHQQPGRTRSTARRRIDEHHRASPLLLPLRQPLPPPAARAQSVVNRHAARAAARRPARPRGGNRTRRPGTAVRPA